MHKKSTKEKRFWAEKVILVGILLLLPNSGYLLAFADDSFFYMLNVFFHVGLGLALLVPCLIYGRRLLTKDAHTGKELAVFTGHFGFWSSVLGIAAAGYLIVVGNFKESATLLYAHVVFCFLGVVFLTTAIRRVGHQISIKNRYDTAGRWLLIFTVTAVCIPIFAALHRKLFGKNEERIHNPRVTPPTLAEEAMGGATGPFYPTSSATLSGDTLDAAFLIDAAACGSSGCHADIYRQWSNSPHRYSAFNNSWYQSALARAEAQAGPTATKWCAGCHSPATLISGVANLPVAQQALTSEAQAGVTCTACHAVAAVRGSTGQGGYVLAKPALFDWMVSASVWKKQMFSWFVHLDAQPHREVFLRPFQRTDTGTFCSSCHKGHVDKPLHGSRWVQVMNDFDSWQASGYGMGARAFQSAPQQKDCATCHMPAVASTDTSALLGKVEDHRFVGANTLLPLLQNDAARLQAVTDYLRNGKITLDIFALHLSPQPRRKPALLPADSLSIFPAKPVIASIMRNASDKWSLQLVANDSSAADSLLAPLALVNHLPASVRSFRLDIVVHANDIGHFFPSGAADMAQAWLELQITDEYGKTLFWSGATRGDRQELVDPHAHFYGVFAVDSLGVRTYHPESWRIQAANANLLPPNSSELIRYRVELPGDCGRQLRITARLNYRKYLPAALASTAARTTAAAESGGVMPFFSEKLNLPIVEMARTEATLYRDPITLPEGEFPSKESLTARWLSYGVGLLRQHDVAAAAQAFVQASKLTPDNPDAWINLGFARLRLGQIAAAQESLQRALQLDSENARAHFYYGMSLKAEGNYEDALDHVMQASDLARRDREFDLELGRLQYLRHHYRRAEKAFKRVIRIDPEDPVPYQELLRAYAAQGGREPAIARTERLLQRYSMDERMQALMGQAQTQNGWPDTSRVYFQEYRSADPSIWPADTVKSGHLVSSSNRESSQRLRN